jgi:hypothetical protein
MSAYTIIVAAGETAVTAIVNAKREAKREARRILRERYRGIPGVKADVEKDGFGLVYQMETYTDAAGKVRIRDLEL